MARKRVEPVPLADVGSSGPGSLQPDKGVHLTCPRCGGTDIGVVTYAGNEYDQCNRCHFWNTKNDWRTSVPADPKIPQRRHHDGS